MTKGGHGPPAPDPETRRRTKLLGRMVGLFEKLDDRSRGTGVGLVIVKRIVEVHGGKVWVESPGRGQGTTVCFTLPTRAPV